MITAAFVGMRMLVADRAGGDQLAAQIGFHGCAGIALGAYNDFHAALVENIDGAAAHAAGNDDLRAVVCQEIGQEAGTVAGIGDGIFCGNFAVCGVKEDKILTMTKVAGNKRIKFSQ